jgi:hypothetical protein
MRHKCDELHGVATDLASNDTLDQWLLRNVSTMHHICGTCKMRPEPNTLAVVDQYRRVPGLTSPRTNTNAVTVMLGERIADELRRGLSALVTHLSSHSPSSSMLKQGTGSHVLYSVCCAAGSWALQQVETLKAVKEAPPLPIDVPSP